MAPLVVHGKVYVGNSGGELGVRGWIKALAAADGRVLWTAYNTGPDSAVKIGPRFQPYYPQDRGTDLGVASWPPDRWQIGGGNVWGFVSYDPEQNLIIHGTGNPRQLEPRPASRRQQVDCGVFARDADTGEARWFYQWSPHDLFDHDGINENILVDRPWRGAPRKLLIHPERNGYVYVLDRVTGQVLAAKPFVRITSSKGVDLTTGRLVPNDVKKPETGKTVRDVAPASPGAKDWQPSAYSPRTGLLYLPHQTLSMDYEGTEANYIAGTPYVGANVKIYADPVDPGDGSRGAFTAWDPMGGKVAWRIKEWFPVWSGTLVTAGDVAFYGTMDGWFKAVDARSGKLLWKHKTESGIIGQPVTYLGPDGKQYVAVLAGVGGWPGAIVSSGLDTRDRTAGGGFVNAMKDLPKVTAAGDLLYVFALADMRPLGSSRAEPAPFRFAMSVSLAGTLALGRPAFAAPAAAPAAWPRVIRVAADPNNLPFTNRRREGFENRIAELIARTLHARIEYVWHAQRRGFFRETLKDGNCDLVLGVPSGFERVLTTRPLLPLELRVRVAARSRHRRPLAGRSAAACADDRRPARRRRRRESAARARARPARHRRSGAWLHRVRRLPDGGSARANHRRGRRRPARRRARVGTARGLLRAAEEPHRDDRDTGRGPRPAVHVRDRHGRAQGRARAPRCDR
jgi:PQQ-dependent dehydrogenase (methanol/ethanol family)